MFLKRFSDEVEQIKFIDNEFMICPICKKCSIKRSQKQHIDITYYCYCSTPESQYVIDIGSGYKIQFVKLKFIYNKNSYYFIINDTLRHGYKPIEIVDEYYHKILVLNNKLNINLPEENIINFIQNLIYKKYIKLLIFK